MGHFLKYDAKWLNLVFHFKQLNCLQYTEVKKEEILNIKIQVSYFACIHTTHAAAMATVILVKSPCFLDGKASVLL